MSEVYEPQRDELERVLALWRSGSAQPPPWVITELDHDLAPAEIASITALDVVDGEPWLVAAQLKESPAGPALANISVEHALDVSQEPIAAMRAIRFGTIREQALKQLEEQASSYATAGTAFPIVLNGALVGWERRPEFEQRLEDIADAIYARRSSAKGGRPSTSDDDRRALAQEILDLQISGETQIRAKLAQKHYVTEAAVKKRVRELRELGLLARSPDGRGYVAGPNLNTDVSLTRPSSRAEDDHLQRLEYFARALVPWFESIGVTPDAAHAAIDRYFTQSDAAPPMPKPRELFAPFERLSGRLKWGLRRAKTTEQQADTWATALARLLDDLIEELVATPLTEADADRLEATLRSLEQAR